MIVTVVAHNNALMLAPVKSDNNHVLLFNMLGGTVTSKATLDLKYKSLTCKELILYMQNYRKR